MASTKLQMYSPLPAPAVLSVPQSKSHVLAGVQDAYWSDEEEDQECPLCLEEMDISDLNFKPCICGYQICRFCWHHIKENLNKRCPACRRIYTDEGVEFKPVATQDHKRLAQQKKQRDREKKELEVLGRKHLANVRVVQRNVVYVVGIGPRFAKEELIPTLRSNEYFGQYGKISKIVIVKRTPPGGSGPVVGLYITYTRREDAARVIAAVDGAASPGGGRDIMRASYGTTKYCMAFLRNQTCHDHNCMNLHEWGDEKDCFTKEDLTTLKHTMKTTETRAKTTVITKKEGEDASLPRAASWGQKSNVAIPSGTMHTTQSSSSFVRQARRPAVPRQTARVSTSSNQTATTEAKPTPVRTATERKSTAQAKFEASVSRPSTPAVPLPTSTAQPSAPASPAVDSKPARLKKEKEKEPSPLVRETNSPAPSQAAESDSGSVAQEVPAPPPPSRPVSTELTKSPADVPQPVVPIPAVPPGLSAPPGIPSPSRPPRHATDSPQTPLLSSQSSYQMSNAARALLDDVKARRESYVPTTVITAPFPEFDRTLQSLSGDDGGGFSFNLDPKLADQAENTDVLPELEMEANTPFHGSYIDAFPALRPNPPMAAPPGLGYSRVPPRSIFDPISRGISPAPIVDKLSNYMGTFNPFQDALDGSSTSSSQAQAPSSPFMPFDEERKVSRFGFARGRQSSSLASSPLNGSSIVALADANTLHSSLEDHAPPPGLSHLRQWDSQRSDSAYSQPPSMINSPLISSQLPYNLNPPPQPPTRFQPFDNDVSETTLREFIMASREREFQKPMNDAHLADYKSHHPFQDPAIMSASFGPVQSHDMSFNSMAYGPPPGLGTVSNQQLNSHPTGIPALPESNHAVTTSTSSPAPSLSAADFPALVPSTPKEEPSPTKPSASLLSKAQEKAAHKAAKKAVATEKAAAKAKAASAEAAAAGEKEAQVPPIPQIASSRSLSSSPGIATNDSKGSASVSIPKARVSQPKSKGDLKFSEGEGTKDGNVVRKEEKVPKAPVSKAAKNVPPTPKQAKQLKAPVPPSIPVTHIQPEVQVPILSRKPKKNKPVAVKVPKTPKEDGSAYHEGQRGGQSAEPSGVSNAQSKTRSPSKSPDPKSRLTVEELLEEISHIHPGMDLISHPFFDLQKLSSTAKMPLEYGPLVHALSALSVGGGSFANNVPSGSIDTAVSSFQQLLETLTQTISDLLRLLPRTTWDDSSSFDGVLRDMLKGDDFLDEAGEDGHGKDDEVAALTLALERRARWMEVQLSKLEELHRDINTAAVKAVLTFNDNGWDKHGYLPRLGSSLKRFESIGLTVDEDGNTRTMTADELEKKLAVAKEAAIFAETEAREAMTKLQYVKEIENEFY